MLSWSERKNICSALKGSLKRKAGFLYALPYGCSDRVLRQRERKTFKVHTHTFTVSSARYIAVVPANNGQNWLR